MFTNWGQGQPDNYKNAQDCMCVTSDGTWDDVDCEKIYPSVCEIEQGEVLGLKLLSLHSTVVL